MAVAELRTDFMPSGTVLTYLGNTKEDAVPDRQGRDLWMESPFISASEPVIHSEISSNVTIPMAISPVTSRFITINELISIICSRFGLPKGFAPHLRIGLCGISVFNVPDAQTLEQSKAVDESHSKLRVQFTCCSYLLNNRLLELTAEGEADTQLASGMVYPPKIDYSMPYNVSSDTDMVLEVTTDCALWAYFNVDVAIGRRLKLVE
jgi:hypothetical protein